MRIPIDNVGGMPVSIQSISVRERISLEAQSTLIQTHSESTAIQLKLLREEQIHSSGTQPVVLLLSIS